MRLALVSVLALLAAGCSWSRFDDVTESTPIVMLNKPKAMTVGFGLSLLPASRNDKTLLFVGGAFGASSAATFDLGGGDSPGVDAIDAEYCDGATGLCFLGAPPAALAHANLEGEEHDLCFPLGLGSTPVQGDGLAMRCSDGVLFSYPLPESYLEDAAFALEVNQADILSLSGDGSDDPWLVAAAPSQPIAWFYRFGSIEPVSLTVPGGPPPSFGKLVHALAAPDGRRLLVVIAPDEDRLFLFRGDETSVAFVGCLGGTNGFGRAVASGVLLGDDQVPDLAISDAQNVHVFDGAALLDLPETSGNVCSLAALPENALISSFGCASGGDVTGCSSAKFGAAIGIGDLDGDDDGELVVGAPGMVARDVSGSGALLVFDVESRGADAALLTESKFISSAEDNDQLGATLALPRVGERSIIAGGAPGNGKVAMFYCSSLLPPELRGDRCK
jgi:hypothetical protein